MNILQFFSMIFFRSKVIDRIHILWICWHIDLETLWPNLFHRLEKIVKLAFEISGYHSFSAQSVLLEIVNRYQMYVLIEWQLENQLWVDLLGNLKKKKRVEKGSGVDIGRSWQPTRDKIDWICSKRICILSPFFFHYHLVVLSVQTERSSQYAVFIFFWMANESCNFFGLFSYETLARNDQNRKKYSFLLNRVLVHLSVENEQLAVVF